MMFAYVAVGMRVVLDLIFIVSSITKIRSRSAYRAFALWVRSLPLPLVRLRLTAPTMVGAEIVTAVLIAVPNTSFAGMALGTAALAIFAGGTLVAVQRGALTTCQCFGESVSPLGPRHVIRDGFLFLLGIAALVLYERTASDELHVAASIMTVASAFVVAAIIISADDIYSLAVQ